MSQQLLLGFSRFVMRAAFVCCLSALALPASAQVGGPRFDSAVCTVQSVNVPMLSPTWQIKGTGSFKGVPAAYTGITNKVRFQMRANSTAAWVNLFEVNQTTGETNGGGPFDTGFQGLTVTPAAGNEFRISVSGDTVANPPDPAIMIIRIGSFEVTPIP